MNFRGSGRYIPRYDTTPPPESESEEDVGDLNFDDVFAHPWNENILVSEDRVVSFSPYYMTKSAKGEPRKTMSR